MALPYFESKGFTPPRNENPADFFLDVIQGKVSMTPNPPPPSATPSLPHNLLSPSNSQ